MNRRGFFVMVAGTVAGLGLGMKGYSQGGYIAPPKKPFIYGDCGPEPMWPANSAFITAIGQGHVIGSGGGRGAWQS